MVQKFAIFADGVTTVKIKITKISMGGENDDVIVSTILTQHSNHQI